VGTLIPNPKETPTEIRNQDLRLSPFESLHGAKGYVLTESNLYFCHNAPGLSGVSSLGDKGFAGTGFLPAKSLKYETHPFFSGVSTVAAGAGPIGKGRMPVLFIGHGSPMNMVLSNSYTKSLENLRPNLPKPEAIMIISAHWLTDGTFVGCMEKPRVIYDFYGFPEELYRIKYPSPGAWAYAEKVVQLSNGQVHCDNDWGLDHASWSVLRHMYPEADVPVFEMSLDYSFNEWQPKPLEYHYKLGSKLLELRTEGVLIIGSGNIVHNLRVIDFENVDAQPYDWAIEFDEKVKSDLVHRNDEALLNCEDNRKTSYAVPTLDHYLPMIYVVAMRGKNEPITFTYEGFQNRSISMRCFRIG